MMKFAKPLFGQITLNLIMWLILALYAALVLFPSYLNHDVAWILYSSGEMLNGAEFGKDILDITPPLIWWLNWPPALVAQLFDLAPAAIFRIYILLLIAISLIFVKLRNPKIEHWKLALAATTLTIMPGYDFGQREHFMVILALPYLAGSMREEGASCTSSKVFSGVLAGIGFCIKPHFLFIPIMVELINMVRTRNIRAVFRCQVYVMVLIGVLYVIATVVFAPEYLTRVVPEAMASYGAYDNPPLQVLKSIASKNILPVLAVGAFVYSRVGWGMATRFLFAAGGAALAALSQSKGWSYHILPVSMMLVLAVLFTETAGKKRAGFLFGLAIAGLAIVLPAMKYSKDLLSPGGRHALVSALSERIKALPDNRSVFAFITSPRDIWPAIISAKGHWTGSAAAVYLLPAAVNRPQDARAALNGERQMTAIAARLIAQKPSLIIINGAKYHLAISQPGFDYPDYLKRYEAYAEVFSQYRETSPVGQYRMFVRIP